MICTKSFLFVILSLLPGLLLTQVQIGNDVLGMEGGEQMGHSVNLSADGRLLVMSGPFRGNNQGSILVFAEVFDSWMFQWGASGIEQGVSGFSTDLSDDGQTLVISSPTLLLGQFNVFEKVGIGYQALGSPVEGPSDENTLFGYRVVISGDGNRIAASAISFDGTFDDVGFVQTFELSNGEWISLGSPLSGETAFGEMGRGLDMSFDGSIMAVGIPTTLDNLGHGEVQVYEFDNGDWELLGSPIPGKEDLTGFSVALSGDGERVAIGAPYELGRVSVYQYDGQDWTQLGNEMTLASSQWSGYAVDISADGNRVLIGAPGTLATSTTGAVGIFDFDGEDWQPAFNEVRGLVGENFASSIDLSEDGQTFAIGIPGSDFGNTDQGRVEVYRIDPIQTNIVSSEGIQIEIHPNPVVDFLTLRGPHAHFKRPVQILNQLGQHIETSYLRDQRVDVHHLKPGGYHLLVPVNDRDYVRRSFIKM